MLEVVDKVSHGILRALGAKSVRIPTGAGVIHAYDVRGPGKGTFVLIHGMGTTATSYLAVVRRLKPRAARVVLIDLPGHGRSAPLRGGLDTETLAIGVRESLDKLLEGERAVILGTSLGGAAALGYALERPERVRALVLASPAGAPPSQEDLEALRARFDLKTREDARRFFSELLHRPPIYLRVMEKSLVDQLSRPLVQAFLSSLGREDFFDAERVSGLAVPATILWGKSDRILPRSGLAFYREALPSGTRVEELDDVGHSPHLERPDLVASQLSAAYARTA